MAEKTSEEFMAQLGFGGTPSTPLTQEFDAGAIRRASYDAAIKAQGTGFWEAAGKRYQQGSLNSILTVMDRPEPSEEPLLLTDDYVNELTDGLTNERAIKTVLDAASEKGLEYGRAIREEVLKTDRLNAELGALGMKGITASLVADIFNPEEAAAMTATASVVAGMSGPAAPVAAPVAAVATRAGKLFGQIKNNKKYLAFAGGVGGTELAAIELLRQQSNYESTGGDVFLAGALGMAGSSSLTKLGQVMQRRANIQKALRDQANEQPLTEAQTELLRRNDDEILAQNYKRSAINNDDFGTEELDDLTRLGTSRKDFTDTTEEELANVPKQRGAFAGARGKLSAYVEAKNSDDGVIRWLADGLGLNSTGNKVGADGKITPVNFGALDQRNMLVNQYRGKIATPIIEQRKAWQSRTNGKVADFNVLVSRQIRNPNDLADPAVKAAADIYSTQMKNLARAAIGVDAAGFDAGTISRIKNYAPRIFNRGNMTRLRKGRLQDNADGTLNEAFFELAEEAIRKGQPDIERNVAKALKAKNIKPTPQAVKAFISRMSRGYMKNVITPQNRNGLKLGDSAFDVDDFTTIMKGEGFSSDEVDVILDVLTGSRTVKGNKRALPRMILDENTSIIAKGTDGETFTLKFTDILEENVENLYDSYVFQLAGNIALAKNGINTNSVGSSFETIISKAKGIGDPKRDSEIDSLRFMYESVTGGHAYKGDLTDTQSQILRRVREVSFATNMGMSGMAALMELSNVLFEYSFSTLIKTVPQYRQLIRAAQSGQIPNRLAREMMAGTGVGSDGLVNKVTTMRSRLEGDVTEGMKVQGEITKFDEMLGHGRVFVSIASGLQGVTDVFRRMTVFNYASEWAYAHKAGKTAFSAIKREQNGISDDMAVRIRQMIDKHAEYMPDGTLEQLNVDKWEFKDAADIFFASAYREATQSVQEMNVGSVNKRVRSEVGKTFFQFLSFPMASMEQQAMRQGVRFANGDAQQVTKIMMTSMLMGSMMYIARSHMNSLGRSDQKEYMERRMETGNIIQGSLSQIGAASLFGYIYQLTTGAMDGNTNALTPAGVSMGLGVAKGVSDLWDAVGEGEISESELRGMLRVLPFNSLYGVRQLLNALAATRNE
ncbi:hypothetical protein N9008_00130 [bacterium]|nr:hypothetical protein [bacterium]